MNEYMVFNFESNITVGTIELRSIPFTSSLGAHSVLTLPSLPDETQKLLKNNLTHTDFYVYAKAYLDALNQIQIRNYKEAIIQINIALENYMYLYASAYLSKIWGKEKTETFLKGEVNYDGYFLKDYMTEENFRLAVSKEIIKNNPPTIYAIIKKCSETWADSISKRKVNSTVAIIKKYRNDIVHGGTLPKNLKNSAEDAINGFEELKTMLPIPTA